jgi:hypothetical protein
VVVEVAVVVVKDDIDSSSGFLISTTGIVATGKAEELGGVFFTVSTLALSSEKRVDGMALVLGLLLLIRQDIDGIVVTTKAVVLHGPFTISSSSQCSSSAMMMASIILCHENNECHGDWSVSFWKERSD